MLLEMALHDERMEGRREGRAEGIAANARDIALDMLKDKMPLAFILKYSRLHKEEVYALAQANGLQVIE